MLDRVESTARTAIRSAALATAGSRPLIRARALTFENGQRRPVDRLDLDLLPATLTVIMGPNGAGKSLLLRLLHGLIEPTGGTVEYAGKPLDRAARASQAMVFQRPVLLRRSVAANIDYVTRQRGLPRAFRDELLERVGLRELASRPARQLSGGEQQRLSLARAIAGGPAVLFLDEPTVSLDPASVALIEAILRQVRAAGTKIVLVTHDIGQARRLADDVAFMHRGAVIEHRPAAEFFAAPASPQAEAFLDGRIVI